MSKDVNLQVTYILADLDYDYNNIRRIVNIQYFGSDIGVTSAFQNNEHKQKYHIVYFAL